MSYMLFIVMCDILLSWLALASTTDVIMTRHPCAKNLPLPMPGIWYKETVTSVEPKGDLSKKGRWATLRSCNLSWSFMVIFWGLVYLNIEWMAFPLRFPKLPKLPGNLAISVRIRGFEPIDPHGRLGASWQLMDLWWVPRHRLKRFVTQTLKEKNGWIHCYSDMNNSKKMIHSKLGFRPRSLELVKYLEKLWTCCCHFQWSPSAWKNVHLKARLCKWKTVESTKIELQMGGSKYTPLMKRLICITNVYIIYIYYVLIVHMYKNLHVSMMKRIHDLLYKGVCYAG